MGGPVAAARCPRDLGCALSDADLVVLGAPADRYAEYTASVRTEYAHVGEDDHRAGRAAVLGALLDKPHLFHTGCARTHWEARARVDVAAEIAALTAR